MKLHTVTFILLVVGGLNWLLVGLFDWNLVMWVGEMTVPMVERIIYVLVGLSAVYQLAMNRAGMQSSSPASTM